MARSEDGSSSKFSHACSFLPLQLQLPCMVSPKQGFFSHVGVLPHFPFFRHSQDPNTPVLDVMQAMRKCLWFLDQTAIDTRLEKKKTRSGTVYPLVFGVDWV